MFPEQAFYSSIRGLKIWWNVVFPALFPFFITAEMMMGFGVVHFIEILLEPLMRPVFRVPGSGAFVMAVGLISGNPMGAKLTAHLRKQNMITREEGERLVSFTSTAGPLFLFGAVGVGFFESTSVGIILAIAHYSSSILVGILMRYYQPSAPVTPSPTKKTGFLLFRAFEGMHHARLEDGRSVGQLLREAVTSAIQTLLLIGGFIMTFSVITHLLSYIHITYIFSIIISLILNLTGIPPEFSTSLFNGFFEMTLGSQVVSTLTSVPLLYKLTIVSVIIAFNGLSIHAQVASMLGGTDIRYLPYLIARAVHAIFAGIVTLVIFTPLQPYLHHLPSTVPAFAQNIGGSPVFTSLQYASLLILLIWSVLSIRNRTQ
jgi:sporulation integral membrane protein YlbJ